MQPEAVIGLGLGRSKSAVLEGVKVLFTSTNEFKNECSPCHFMDRVRIADHPGNDMIQVGDDYGDARQLSM